jgi:hypothetical protein
MRYVVVAASIIAACGPRGAAVESSSSGAANAPAQIAAIDSAELMRDIGVLAHDSMEGRQIGTPGGARARAFLERRVREIQLTPVGGGSFIHAFATAGRAGADSVRGANVVGMVRGRTKPDSYIVISAHYDHLGVRNGEVFNGADDNASGTAAVLQLAEYFKQHQPQHSMIFALFDGEEGGLRGANAFVSNPPVPKSGIALNINMDMVGRNDKNELYVTGTKDNPSLLPYIQKIIPISELKLIAGHDTAGPSPSDNWTGASDHGAFRRAQIPYLYFGEEDHPDYHKASDEVVRIQPGFYARAVRTVLAATRLLDTSL